MAGSTLLSGSLLISLPLSIATAWALPSSHCWIPSPACLLPRFLLSFLLIPSSPSTRRCSASCCSAAYAYAFLCSLPLPDAAASAGLMCWGIMSPPALGQSGTLHAGGGPHLGEVSAAAVATNVLVRDLNLQAARCW